MIADYFVIASAKNTRHARAIASGVTRAMKQVGKLRRNSGGTEGESSWVLLDFDEVVVHVLQTEAREFYDLESLWADVPRVDFEPSTPSPEASGNVTGAWESFPDSTGTL